MECGNGPRENRSTRQQALGKGPRHREGMSGAPSLLAPGLRIVARRPSPSDYWKNPVTSRITSAVPPATAAP